MTSPSPSRSSANAPDPLAAFREPAKEFLLHPLEIALLWVAGATLCFLPWAMGGMRSWAQWTGLGLSALALVLALWPRHYSAEYAREGAFRMLMWRRLLRFPLFWLGLALVGYVVVQALNPAWEFVPLEKKSWTMRAVTDAIGWLPSGMRTPFEMMSPWRTLVIWLTPWLLGCALWTGLTRRASVQALLIVIVANGALLALAAILQRATGSTLVLWSFKPTTGYHLATFPYKNHAGAFFNLVVAAAVALLIYHHERQARRFGRSGPAPVFAFAAMLAGTAVLLSYSRAATFLLLGFLIVAVVLFLVRLAFYRREQRSPLVVGIICVMFAGFAAAGVSVLNLDKAVDRVNALFTPQGQFTSITQRQIAVQASLDMAERHLAKGWGAGGFRFLFPAYQQAYPEITNPPGNNKRFLFWEHAHNDYVEFLVELGVLGLVPIALGLVYALGKFSANGGWRRPHALLALLGLGLILAHAWVDFPFQNPAILCTWSALAVLLLLWTSLETRRVS